MREQKIMPLKNLAAINKLLLSGWEFSHTIGPKNEFALLNKFRNPTQPEMGAQLRYVGNELRGN